MERSFEPLTDAELEWVSEQLTRAEGVALQFDAQATSGRPTLESLDRAFVNFLTDDRTPDEVNELLNAVGVALGSELVERLEFDWVIGADDYGTGLAVLARPGRGDAAIFPQDFVAKRYERREAPFLVDAVDQIRGELRKIAADWGDDPLQV